MKNDTRGVPAPHRAGVPAAMLACLLLAIQCAVGIDENPSPEPYPPPDNPPPTDPCGGPCEGGCDADSCGGGASCSEAGSVFFSLDLGRARFERKTDLLRNAIVAGRKPALSSTAHRNRDFRSLNQFYRQSPLTGMRQFKLWIAEESMARPIYSRSAIKLDEETAAETIPDNDGIRQILTYDRFVDIQSLDQVGNLPTGVGALIPEDREGYVIRTWQAGTQGTKSGDYYPLPEPDPLSWTIIYNPDEYPNEHRLAIIHMKVFDDTLAYKTESHLHEDGRNAQGNRVWTLKKFAGLPTGDPIEVVDIAYGTYQNERKFTRVRTVSRAALRADGTPGGLGVVEKVFEEYDDIDGLSRIIRKIDAYQTGAARETSYGWYDMFNTQTHGLPRYVIHPDGSYEHHTYSFNLAAKTGTVTRRTPWKDNTWTPSETPPADSECVKEVATIESTTRIVTVRSVSNSPIARTTEEWTTEFGDLVFIESQRYDGSNDLVTYLITKTGYYPSTAAAHLANRIKWRELPDGTAETYGYTAPSGGDYEQTVERGAGSRSGISAGTRVKSTRNTHGVTVIEETHEFGTFGTFLIESWGATEETVLGRIKKKVWTTDANGNDYEETAYDCCGIASHRDRRGVQTAYHRDSLKRVWKTVRTEGANVLTTTTAHTFGEDPPVLIEETRRSSGALENHLVSKTWRNLLGDPVKVHHPDQNGDNNPEATLYDYDYPSTGGGRVVTVTRPDGSTEITAHLADGRIASRTGTGVNNIRYDYDFHSDSEKGGGLWSRTIALDANGATTAETATTYYDPAGRPFRTEFNSEIATANTNDSITHDYFEYTAPAGSRGRRSSTTDPDGVTTSFTYDSQGRLYDTTELMPVGASTTRVTRREYSAADISGVGDALITTTSLNNIEVSKDIRAGHGYASRTIENQSRVTTTTRSVPADANAHTWHETTTHPDGTITRSYIVGGRLAAATRWESGSTPDASAPEDITDVATTGFIEGQSYTYDALGRTLTSTDSRTGTTQYTLYTEAGNLLSMTEPGNHITTFAYDNMGRRVTVDRPNTAIVGGTSQNITHTSHTPKGEIRAVWGDQTNPTFRVYDEQGRLTGLHTWRTAPTTLTHTTDDPPTGSALTAWEYHSSRGFLIRKEYAGGNGTSYTHTAAGRVKTRTWQRGNRTRYDYRRGFLVAQRHFTDATGDNGTNAGDDADTPDIGFTHDAFGRTTSSVTINTANHTGTRVNHDYSPTGNLRLLREAIIISPTLGFTLGSTSQAISITENPAQRTLFRVLHRDADSATLANTGTHLRHTSQDTSTRDIGTTYTYNERGLLHTAIARFPAGDRTFEYHYDYYAAGGLHVGTSGGTASSIPFAVESPIHTVIRAYDTTRHALRSIENHVDSTLVSGYTYQVNEIGQRTAVTTDGDVFGSHPANWTWGYDARGQVGSAKHEDDGGFSCFYDYDHMGNRKESRTGTHTAAGGEVTAYDRNNLNQYIEIDPPAEDAFVPGYDDDGNLTGGPLPVAKDQLNTLDWDGRNQLIRVYQGTGEGKVPLAAYTYDAHGRRVVKTDAQGSQRDYFLYDGWNLVAEYRGAVHTGGAPPALTLRRTWSWGLDLSATLQGAGGVGGMLAMRNTDANLYYPTYDGNGNVSEYLESDGDPAAHMEYDPFGNLLSTSTGAFADFPHKFSTKYTDTETGLLYYGYRWYDPVTGRWPSRDPIGEEGGMNLNGFVGNNGVDRVDGLGKKRWANLEDSKGTMTDNSPGIDVWVKHAMEIHLPDMQFSTQVSVIRITMKFRGESEERQPSMYKLDVWAAQTMEDHWRVSGPPDRPGFVLCLYKIEIEAYTNTLKLRDIEKYKMFDDDNQNGKLDTPKELPRSADGTLAHLEIMRRMKNPASLHLKLVVNWTRDENDKVHEEPETKEGFGR